MKVLVNNLLDLSKIEAGKMQMELEPVPVGILLEKAVAVLKAQADSKTVELSFDAPKNLPRAVADANKITWVLTNLISNALRYTKNEMMDWAFRMNISPQFSINSCRSKETKLQEAADSGWPFVRKLYVPMAVRYGWNPYRVKAVPSGLLCP